MTRCQRVHDMREYPVDVGSPQTQQQREQVIRIISRLIQHEKEELLKQHRQYSQQQQQNQQHHHHHINASKHKIAKSDISNFKPAILTSPQTVLFTNHIVNVEAIDVHTDNRSESHELIIIPFRVCSTFSAGNLTKTGKTQTK